MTVVRALKKQGYVSSYNLNGKYYVLGDVAHLLSRLVREGRISEHRLAGRQVVYLAAEPGRAQQQWQQRQQLPVAPALAGRVGLPDGVAAGRVIDILRQMIVVPGGRPALWTRQLKARGVTVAEEDVRRVSEHYGLKKNDGVDHRQSAEPGRA